VNFDRDLVKCAFVIGRGARKSDAADNLLAYLATNHAGTSQKIASTLRVDLSHTTEPQLLAMAREALPP
jgi:hypothetical protein